MYYSIAKILSFTKKTPPYQLALPFYCIQYCPALNLALPLLSSFWKLEHLGVGRRISLIRDLMKLINVRLPRTQRYQEPRDPCYGTEMVETVFCITDTISGPYPHIIN